MKSIAWTIIATCIIFDAWSCYEIVSAVVAWP